MFSCPWILAAVCFALILSHAFYGYSHIATYNEDLRRGKVISLRRVKRIIDLWDMYRPPAVLLQHDPNFQSGNADVEVDIFSDYFAHVPQSDRDVYLECMGGLVIDSISGASCMRWNPRGNENVARHLLGGHIFEIIILKSAVLISFIILSLYLYSQGVWLSCSSPSLRWLAALKQFLKEVCKHWNFCMLSAGGESERDRELHHETVGQRCQLARNSVLQANAVLVPMLLVSVLHLQILFPVINFDHDDLAGTRCFLGFASNLLWSKALMEKAQSTYLAGGSDGHCPAGYIRVQTSECARIVFWNNGPANETTWAGEYCATYSTPGTGCFTDGVSLYSTRAECSEAHGQTNHKAVCAKVQPTQQASMSTPVRPWLFMEDGCEGGLQQGDGHGGSALKIGTDIASASDCMELLMMSHVQTAGANGFTFGKAGGGRDGECYAEFNMSGVHESQPWVTCQFKKTCIPGNRLAQHLIGSPFLPLTFACLILMGVRSNMQLNLVPIPSSLDIANVLLSGMWVWRIWTAQRVWYIEFSALCWCFRIIQGVALGNYRLTIGLHVIVTAASILAFIRHGFGDGVYVLGYILRQCSMLLLASTITLSFDKLLVYHAGIFVELKRSNCARALVRRLLSALCDCVVHVNGDLNVSEPCPHLAGLLLRTPTFRPFTELLHHSDEERFVRHVEEEMRHQSHSDLNSDQASLARPLHVNLLDAHGVLIPVELFCSGVRNASQTFHLLGIRVETDLLQWTEPQDATNTDVNQLRAYSSSFAGPYIDELSCTSSNADEVLPILGEHVCTSLGIPESAAAVWIDPNTPELRLVRVNTKFSLLGAPSLLIEEFIHMLPDEATMWLFHAEVHRIVNIALKEEDRAQNNEGKRIQLAPFRKKSGNHRLIISARYALTCDQDDYQQPSDNSPLVGVILTEITENFKKPSFGLDCEQRSEHRTSMPVGQEKDAALATSSSNRRFPVSLGGTRLSI